MTKPTILLSNSRHNGRLWRRLLLLVRRPQPPVALLTTLLLLSAGRHASAAGEKTFKVMANAGWQDTGVRVDYDDKVTITLVSGQWSAGAGQKPYGPEGALDTPSACMPVRAKGAHPGMLIGKIGTSGPFPVGAKMDDAPGLKGALFLRMNDCDNSLADNSGSLTVRIRVIGAIKQ